MAQSRSGPILDEEKIIATDSVKYALYSSFTTPHSYFNRFIDKVYDTPDGYEKLLVV